jgi:hypothetical protein
MTEERMPTFIPGDEPTYQIAFVCSVNIETVTAVFRNQTTGAEIILTGEAQMIAKPRVRGARTHTALLHVDRDSSDEPETGRYRLARLEARTYRGTHSSWIHRLGAYHGVVRGCYVTLAFPPRPFSLTALSHELLRRGILGNLFLMPTAQTHPAYERP